MKKLILLVIVLAGVGLAAESLKLVYNGAPSKLQVKDGRVPVYLPTPEAEEQVYEVRLKRDGSTIQVTTTLKKPPVRGGEDCWHCTGSGKCQNDYPAGSGSSVAGEACVQCNGTAKCWYCGGSGKS